MYVVYKILFSLFLTQISLIIFLMQIPNIRNFVTSGVNYFIESSWQGKTVQVLCVILIPTLVYLAFRKKTPPQGQGSDTPPPTTLSGRVNKQPIVKETPKGSDVSSKSGPNGVQTEPQVQELPKGPNGSSLTFPSSVLKNPTVSKELPKAAHSYIQIRVDPDLSKFPESEFGKWLSFKRKDLSEWSKWASSGVKQQEGFCYQALKKFIPEFKKQVNKMIRVFEVHGVKKKDADVFLQECNKAGIGPKTNLVDFCMELKGYFDALQSWDTALHDQKEKRLEEMLKAVPHYEFTHLQTQYFHYLGLNTKEDFSRLVSANITHLESYGLKGMDDIDCLELRAMQPSIERLRQLVCSLMINGDERAHSQILSGVSKEQEGLSLTQPQSKVGECVSEEPLHCRIEKEIEQCKEVLRISDNLSDKLTYGGSNQKLRDSVNLLRGLFDELSSNLANGLDLLKKIENEDIARQLILLKGYIHQYGQKAKWKQLNEMEIFSLADCAQIYDINTLSKFYQMDQIGD
jgi:hypothetical protein